MASARAARATARWCGAAAAGVAAVSVARGGQALEGAQAAWYCDAPVPRVRLRKLLRFPARRRGCSRRQVCSCAASP